MRQRSQAFQTRLCLPSMPALWVTWSWWWAAAALLELEPARLVMRWACLADLALEELFLDMEGLGSSAGGEGRLFEPIAFTGNVRVWDRDMGRVGSVSLS